MMEMQEDRSYLQVRTVGELRATLEGLPDEMPLSSSYPGRGGTVGLFEVSIDQPVKRADGTEIRVFDIHHVSVHPFS